MEALKNVIVVRRVEGAGDAAELFRKRFKQPIPANPAHYIATYLGGESPRLVGYVHMTRHNEVSLCGGLCVDEMAYRTMKPEELQALRRFGGVAKLLMVAASQQETDSRAVFACTGHSGSRRIIEDIGFERVVEPWTYALWTSGGLDPAEKQRLIDDVVTVGLF